MISYVACMTSKMYVLITSIKNACIVNFHSINQSPIYLQVRLMNLSANDVDKVSRKHVRLITLRTVLNLAFYEVACCELKICA